MSRFPSAPYVVPFALFLAFLGLTPLLSLPPRAEAFLWVASMIVVLIAVARPALDFRVVHPVATIVIGIAVFVIWIAPDVLIPGYRASTIFQNSVVGTVKSSLTEAERADVVVIALRFVRAAIIVPIVEELFWRGWLPRWVDDPSDFRRIPLGAFTRWSFAATAVLFALEHGSYWDVGLVAGLVYNAWMWRARSLGDLILCHAVTNACLSCYVLLQGKWEYW